MKRQVTYLMSGPAHMPYLVCSLYTLRLSGYDGNIRVYAWPESDDLVAKIAEDKSLDIEHVSRAPKLLKRDGVGGNAQFLDKIDLTMGLDPETVSLYLDADTTIHGSLDILFETAEREGFCATQFNGWESNRGIIGRRLNDLYGVEGIPKELVAQVLANPYPSVNGGVWSAVPSDGILPQWYEWTKMCGSLFISDERVLHLMMPYAKLPVLTGNGKWNCSHKHCNQDLDPDDVVIWHYHGDSNVRIGKSPDAFDFWMGIFEQCIRNNIGDIRSWWKETGNRYIEEAMKVWNDE